MLSSPLQFAIPTLAEVAQHKQRALTASVPSSYCIELYSVFRLYLCPNLLPLLEKLRLGIIAFIDFFHRPVAKIFPIQTFRYLACGGSNTVLNIFIDFLAFTYLLHKLPLHIYGNLAIAPEVVAFLIAFSVCFPIGFLLSRYIIFPESNLHGRIQLFRFLLTNVSFILMNYLMIKAFAYFLPFIHQTVRYAFICVFLAITNYILQRTFTFKTIAEKPASV